MTNPITQEDREAAADLVWHQADPATRASGAGNGIRAGSIDEHPAVKAFARHRLSAKQEATREIVAAIREAVDQGYPSPRVTDQCAHGKSCWDDCIVCYDEFLYGKLDAIEQGQHTNQRDSAL